jgi:Na+/glutamate symporter
MDLVKLEQLIEANWPLFAILAIWSLIWKGFALWQTARFSQKWWFIFILIINSMGILEIIYLFFVPKPKSVPADNSSN